MMIRRFALACLLACSAPLAAAQGSLERGDVVVYYSAVASDTLSADVAQRYAITRSPTRALLQVTVQRRDASGSYGALRATVSGAAIDAAGRRQTLALREVREGDSISYLAEPRIEVPGSLAFELAVRPAGASQPLTVRFEQAFFAPLR